MNCLLVNRGKQHKFKRACEDLKLSRFLICNYCISFLNNKCSNTVHHDNIINEESDIIDNNLFEECNFQNNHNDCGDLNG